jgi:hypothetical protein
MKQKTRSALYSLTAQHNGKLSSGTVTHTIRYRAKKKYLPFPLPHNWFITLKYVRLSSYDIITKSSLPSDTKNYLFTVICTKSMRVFVSLRIVNL